MLDIVSVYYAIGKLRICWWENVWIPGHLIQSNSTVDVLPGSGRSEGQFVWRNANDRSIFVMEIFDVEDQVALEFVIDPYESCCSPGFGAGILAQRVSVDIVD